MEHKMGCACEECRKIERGRLHPAPVSNSRLIDGLNVEPDKRDKLLNDIYKFLNYGSVPTQYATDGYRDEYLKAIRVLREQIEKVLGI